MGLKADEERKWAALSIQNLLKLDGNKHCADCEATSQSKPFIFKAPKWASTTLGIFICVHCAGIHRKIGASISKIKSVNLDAWTAKEVDVMREKGNITVNDVYEAELPADFDRPNNNSILQHSKKSPTPEHER
ncbi:stromal membrane-associated protein 1-like [Ylistrum balloti]|uniref:stromal membrane-associated protein 1-like n=1 Tax=Ylistrum balloti TaxID=509963 RepID=UPI00290584DB|nr:stromal membrane-associated protein 1-like [Ylistrum balloti]